MTMDSPNQACSLQSYAVNCEVPLKFAATTCRCYQGRMLGSGVVDSNMSGMNETVDPEIAGTSTSEQGRNGTADPGMSGVNETDADMSGDDLLCESKYSGTSKCRHFWDQQKVS